MRIMIRGRERERVYVCFRRELFGLDILLNNLFVLFLFILRIDNNFFKKFDNF